MEKMRFLKSVEIRKMIQYTFNRSVRWKTVFRIAIPTKKRYNKQEYGLFGNGAERMKVYCFIPAAEADEIIECGLKLNSRLMKRIPVGGMEIPCFEAYLHPEDGTGASEQDVLVKITLPEGKAYIADQSLVGELGDLYYKSIIPADQYKLGKYRKPCCLITCTVLPEMIERYNPDLDEPLLYQSSEQLYRDSLFYRTDDLTQSFKDIALNAYYNMKAASGEYAVQFNQEYAAFTDRATGEVIAVVRTKFNQEKG